MRAPVLGTVPAMRVMVAGALAALLAVGACADSDDPSTNIVPRILSHVSKEELPITLIGLSLNSNKLHFYAAKQWEVNGVDDLVKAIVPKTAGAAQRQIEIRKEK